MHKYLLLNKLNNELKDCSTIKMHFWLVNIFIYHSLVY